LPGFASYPLIETQEGREMLYGYYALLMDMARHNDVGVFLESLTWVANRDRGAAYYLINCAHPDHFSKVLDDEELIETRTY